MPTISEDEYGSAATDALLNRYSGLGQAGTNAQYYDHTNQCLFYTGTGNGNDCLCHEALDLDFGIGLENDFDVGAEDYPKVQNFIPRFVRPDRPCDYCATRHLDCFMTYGQVTCQACENLFKSCSFAHVNIEQGAQIEADFRGFIDTLHVVPEDACQEQCGLTGIRLLRSKGGTATPNRSDDGHARKSSNRFSRAVVKVLRDWLQGHAENPYPTEDEKVELEQHTGLKQGQIGTWLANARRRNIIVRDRKFRSSSPRPASSAVDIPSPSNVTTWGELNPLERWQHSPPENEPAPFKAIANAVAASGLPHHLDSPRSDLGYREQGSSNQSNSSAFKAHSITSIDTGQSTPQSASSSAAWSGSYGSHGSFGSFSSFGSGLHGKKDRTKRRRVAPPVKKRSDDRIRRLYQCTFCTDTFKSKYDWTRHEKSLHISLEKYMCAPLGPTITDPESGVPICVYCLEVNPTKEHAETHGHRECEDKGVESRTFYRKDHLRQHLRLMHGCELASHMECWRSSAKYINSRCGFCRDRFTTWQERVDHLAEHYKDGAHMREWKGCRGLDPAVAAHVTNSMPPFLIGNERTSLIPFSASDARTWRNDPIIAAKGGFGNTPDTGMSANTEVSATTCWEILTVRLGRFAKAQSDKGMILTDEALQQQARLILYDSDDPWNQTAADNQEWLDLFKKAAGLDYIPSEFGGTGLKIPEDLEVYGDLGLRVPFSEQNKRGESTSAMPSGVPSHMAELARQRRLDSEGGDISSTQTLLFQRYSSLQLPPNEGPTFAVPPRPDQRASSPTHCVTANARVWRDSAVIFANEPVGSNGRTYFWNAQTPQNTLGPGPAHQSALSGLSQLDMQLPEVTVLTAPGTNDLRDETFDSDLFDFDMFPPPAPVTALSSSKALGTQAMILSNDASADESAVSSSEDLFAYLNLPTTSTSSNDPGLSQMDTSLDNFDFDSMNFDEGAFEMDAFAL